MTRRLSGRVGMVTGGSRGIGAAIARRLARDGADVAITCASSSARADEVVGDIEAACGRAVAQRAVSADATALKGAVATVEQALGRLDVLVNNAGIAIVKPLDQYGLEEFERMVATNVLAVIVASQEASRHMTEGGRSVTIGSIDAERMPFTGGSVYAMTKAAVAGLTRGMARDLGPRGITANTVQPEPADTDMNPAERPFADGLKALMALPRYGQTDEIAGLVAHLAGPDAAFVTGAAITIDGGFAT